MMSFKLKQVGLALCLMASLLTASPAACTCSHHEEAKASETDCHSHHKAAGAAGASQVFDVLGESCVCVIDQREPFAGSRSISKELKAFDAVLKPEEIASIPEFAAVTKYRVSTSEFAGDLSFSNTLRSLLPSRAPPRL